MSGRHIDLLIAELAAELGLPGMRLDESGCVVISAENGLEIVLNYMDEDELLILYTDLGRIPESRREDLYAALLKGNFGWQTAHGTTLSTTPGGRRAVLQSQVPRAQLNLPALSAGLDHFFQWASLWQTMLSDDEAVAGEMALVQAPVDPMAFV